MNYPIPNRIPSPCRLHHQFRDTFVLEFYCDSPVGTDQAGEEKVCRYLEELAGLLNLPVLQEPRAHLSPLYGLSGWVPLGRSSAVHLYAWDDRQPSFISIDISTRTPLPRSAIIRHAQDFFEGQPENTVSKSLHDGATHWRELAPTICRQRLAMRGLLSRPPRRPEVEALLPALSQVLDMRVLSKPFVKGQAAWMHWETSGVVMDWEDGLDLDIYTCKPFIPEKAVTFVATRLAVTEISNLNF